jgi:uncharacterized protein (DUF885 family)
MKDPFELSHALVDETAELSPILATNLGIPGYDDLWPDFGPDGIDRQIDLVERYRRAFAAHLEHLDPWQRLAAHVVHDNLSEQSRAYAAGDHLYDVAHMASSFEWIKMVFDVMDTTTAEGWANVCRRLETIGSAYDGYRARLELALDEGKVSAARQARSIVTQARNLAGPGSAFAALSRRADGFPSVSERLVSAIETARAEAGRVADFVESRYLPAAPEADGVGEERYLRSVDEFLGLEIDPHEVYGWAWEELHRIRREMQKVGQDILPGASIAEVADVLDNDPERAAPNQEAFAAFVRARLEAAVDELDGPHFDVPDPVKSVSVTIAPPGGPPGAYYVPPSEDFSRPGGVWYSMPAEDGPVPLYKEVSTAYHEGFPGHHLQVALTRTFSDRLSRFHRSIIWYPGYGEGWALYTERLMEELGYFEKPEYVFGMLASHVFRASRVVVDLGLHLGLEISAGSPLHAGEPWTFERAVEFMQAVGMQAPDYAESEVLRYLGWPAQAISYKLGEREILDLRETARRREGPGFDLKAFHGRVLGHGEMRLDLLRQVVLEGWG